MRLMVSDMNATYIRLHWLSLCVLLALSLMLLGLFALAGELKASELWSWFDIVGEGGTAVLVLVWLGLMLASRPRGRVTLWLCIGFSGVFIACWVDLLDEFYQLPKAYAWRHALESIPMWLGMLTLTYGLYLWYTEQLAIGKQLRKKEALFRNHLTYDSLTPLAGGSYLKQYLKRNKSAGFLIAIDVDNFQAVNRQYSYAEGDRILKSLSELLSLALTEQDLLVRQGADRFVAVLANSNINTCEQTLSDLKALVSAFPFKTTSGETLHLSVTCAIEPIAGQEVSSILSKLHRAMDCAKPAIAYGA